MKILASTWRILLEKLLQRSFKRCLTVTNKKTRIFLCFAKHVCIFALFSKGMLIWIFRIQICFSLDDVKPIFRTLKYTYLYKCK